eukprot:Colp12_sorted_trinity150504_noHs@31058
MYQWVEHVSTRRINEGQYTREEKSYSYRPEWRSEVINSAAFDNAYGHENPGQMPMQSFTQTAPAVKVGSFLLSKNLVNDINDWNELPVNTKANSVSTANTNFRQSGNAFYSGQPYQPIVGDIRVSFSYAGASEGGPSTPTTVSVVAKCQGDHLVAYNSKVGGQLEMLYTGSYSAYEMFEMQHTQNTMLTWFLRGLGFVLMWIGLYLCTAFIYTLVDWIPIVRTLVGLGLAVINFSLAISLSLITIALGWLRYRPVFAFTLLALAAVPLYLNYVRAKRQTPPPASNEKRTS